MGNYNALKETIKVIANGVMDGACPGGFTRARLVSISPLKFELNSKLSLYGQFLVTPKYKVFREEDIGKDFVFFRDFGGQTFYYAYEPTTVQGTNGVPYHFEGEVLCELHGTCPDGDVVVTHGYMKSLEHKRQVGD